MSQTIQNEWVESDLDSFEHLDCTCTMIAVILDEVFGFHQEKCSTVSEETSSEVQTGLCADGSSSTFHPCVAILVSTTNKYHHVSWCLIWSAIHMHL